LCIKEKFLGKVESLEEEIIELTRDLVRIPSENPPGNEEEISQYVSEKMEALGFKIEFVEPEPKRVNTLGILEGNSRGINFLFNGHYDTVPIGNLEFWSMDPFEGMVEERKIYGRGAGDMKGGIASAIIAAQAMIECGIRLKGNFLIHAVSDEETGSKFGTRYLVENGYESRENVDLAVIGEGSVFKNKIYARTAVRGLQWLKIVSKGKAVHGSRPEEGVNAVLNMCKILLALNKHTFKFTPHSLLPKPTIAAGTLINGGTKANVIPELCEAVCDVRVIPGMSSEDVINEAQDVINKLKKKDPDINAEVSSLFWWPTSEISKSENVFQIANSAVRNVSGYDLVPRGTSGSNDTAWLTGIAKIPAMAFGPGDNYQSGAHGANEWVSIDRLVDFAKIYGLMAIEACGIIN
jgi:acetylornithine deacetylase/succinyl-diaminopimelate desuccinylase family protein